MENLDEYTVPLDPETEMFCTLNLFKNVENTEEVRKKVMSGELCSSVIKAALIVDPFQVLVAANKAAINEKLNQLTTKTLYTEVLFCLSMSRNISRSLAEFGINDNDKNILVVTIHKQSEQGSLSNMIIDSINGEKVLVSELSQFTDLDLVQKTYKIDKDELHISNLTDSIVSRISCKDFVSLK